MKKKLIFFFYIIKDTFLILFGSLFLLLFYFIYRKFFIFLLRRFIISLGPVFIKITQVLSTRTDSLTNEFIVLFSQLRDNVPVEKKRTLLKILKRSYPQGLAKVFTEFNYTSIGSGCVCQVHAARLINGKKVAVKILRTNALIHIEASFVLIYSIIGIVHLFFKVLRTINVFGMIGELKKLLTAQTDLNQEMKNMEEFRYILKEEPIVIPEPYPNYSNKEVLVMELIENVILPYELHKFNVDSYTAAKKFDDVIDKTIYEYGLLHADMHPGNFFWTKDLKLVLIDFGLVYHISFEERSRLLIFYLSIVDKYYDYITEYFFKYFVDGFNEITEDKRKNKYNKAFSQIDEILLNYWVNVKPNFEKMLNDIFKVLGAEKLFIKPTYTSLFLTLITTEGYLFLLNPKYNTVENMRQKRLEAAEYASVPEEAEKLILGKNGTYSVGMFNQNSSLEESYSLRESYIFDKIRVSQDNFVIDVGCGRGNWLSFLKSKGINGLGLTISRIEQEACLKKEIDCVWTSWEESDEIIKKYPIADAITIIEMIGHLATLFENKEGFLDARINRLFKWCYTNLKDEGTLFVQTINIRNEFLTDEKYSNELKFIYDKLPWLGFPTYEQIINSSGFFFEIIECLEHYSDLKNTYSIWKERFDSNNQKLKEIIKPKVFNLLKLELETFNKLIDLNQLTGYRFVLRKKKN